MFNTSKILNFLDFTQEKGVNCDIFGKNLRMEVVLLVYVEQIVISYFYSNTNKLQFFLWEATRFLASVTQITHKG